VWLTKVICYGCGNSPTGVAGSYSTVVISSCVTIRRCAESFKLEGNNGSKWGGGGCGLMIGMWRVIVRSEMAYC
jgi:hypothetical protein